MKTACLLKQLRRAFPDAIYITIETESRVTRQGQIEVTHALSIKLACGTYFLHESPSMKKIRLIAERILQLSQDFKEQDDEVLTANQVFRSFALSSPASVVKVEG